ncbi:DNA recombination protein RmuC, partial [Bordetella pertussis]
MLKQCPGVSRPLFLQSWFVEIGLESYLPWITVAAAVFALLACLLALRGRGG